MRIDCLEGQLNLYGMNWHGGNVLNLIILAHGALLQRNSPAGVDANSFVMPAWATLFFYLPHGYLLTRHSYPDYLMMGKYPPVEAFMPGEKVPDYTLQHLTSSPT